MTHSPQMTGTKTCTKCGEEKPVIFFPAQKGAADGLHPLCRLCACAESKKNRVARKRHRPMRANGASVDPRGPVHTFEEWKETQ